MKVSPFLAPVVGIIVTTSASIAFDGVAKQLVPTDLKALPAFGIKIGVAIVGGLLAGKLAQIVTDNINSVVETVYSESEPENETVAPDPEAD